MSTPFKGGISAATSTSIVWDEDHLGEAASWGRISWAKLQVVGAMTEYRDSEVWRLLPNSIPIEELSDSQRDAQGEEHRITWRIGVHGFFRGQQQWGWVGPLCRVLRSLRTLCRAHNLLRDRSKAIAKVGWQTPGLFGAKLHSQFVHLQGQVIKAQLHKALWDRSLHGYATQGMGDLFPILQVDVTLLLDMCNQKEGTGHETIDIFSSWMATSHMLDELDSSSMCSKPNMLDWIWSLILLTLHMHFNEWM